MHSREYYITNRVKNWKQWPSIKIHVGQYWFFFKSWPCQLSIPVQSANIDRELVVRLRTDIFLGPPFPLLQNSLLPIISQFYDHWTKMILRKNWRHLVMIAQAYVASAWFRGSIVKEMFYREGGKRYFFSASQHCDSFLVLRLLLCLLRSKETNRNEVITFT